MGGAVIANYAVGNGGNPDLVNPTQYKFGAYSLWDQNYAVQHSTGGYTQGGLNRVSFEVRFGTSRFQLDSGRGNFFPLMFATR